MGRPQGGQSLTKVSHRTGTMQQLSPGPQITDIAHSIRDRKASMRVVCYPRGLDCVNPRELTF